MYDFLRVQMERKKRPRVVAFDDHGDVPLLESETGDLPLLESEVSDVAGHCAISKVCGTLHTWLPVDGLVHITVQYFIPYWRYFLDASDSNDDRLCEDLFRLSPTVPENGLTRDFDLHEMTSRLVLESDGRWRCRLDWSAQENRSIHALWTGMSCTLHIRFQRVRVPYSPDSSPIRDKPPKIPLVATIGALWDTLRPENDTLPLTSHEAIILPCDSTDYGETIVPARGGGVFRVQWKFEEDCVIHLVSSFFSFRESDLVDPSFLLTIT